MAQLKNTAIYGRLDVTETASFNQDVVVKGNLYVRGTSSYVHTEDLKVIDKNIELAVSASTPELVDGAGIYFGKDLNLFFTYSAANDDFEFSRPVSGTITDCVTYPVFNAYTASTTSSFGGTASYATTASYALNAQGEYLPITGGILRGKLSIEGSLSGGPLEQGQDVTASGIRSHAQGGGSEAKGNYSHAEGQDTYAQGDYSHAEGRNTIAVGIGSHAEGLMTSASADYQTVVGRLNIPDTESKYVFLVGNGIDTPPSWSEVVGSDVRSNAFGVRLDGDIDMQEGHVLHGTASYALVAQSVISSGSLIVETASYAQNAEKLGETLKKDLLESVALTGGGNSTLTASVNVGGSTVSGSVNLSHTHTLLLGDSCSVQLVNGEVIIEFDV